MHAPARPRRSPGLSAVLQRAIVVSAALATLLFALPLAAAVGGLYRNEIQSSLARDAERVRAELTNAVAAGNSADQVVVPRAHGRNTTLGVYDISGARIAGTGPATAEALVTRAGRTGIEENGVLDGQVMVAVPVLADDEGRYVVRAAEPYGEVRSRTYLTWAVMAGLAALVLAVVAAFGRARARQIARPLQSLAEAADALGQGDFSVRALPAGVAEVDAAGESLARTARRLGGMLERERAFTADASHQLRTPLTAVRIGIESALLTPGADVRAAAEDALIGLDRLEQTVLDLLALARDTGGPGEGSDVAAALNDVCAAWARPLEERDRGLETSVEAGLPDVASSAPALRTVLDVLLSNALTHGAGTVRLAARAAEETVVIEVSDEGSGVTGEPNRIFHRRSAESRGTGIGLALARSLVEADGGRLELMRAVPPTFAVLLPMARPGAHGAHGAVADPTPGAGAATGPPAGNASVEPAGATPARAAEAAPAQAAGAAPAQAGKS